MLRLIQILVIIRDLVYFSRGVQSNDVVFTNTHGVSVTGTFDAASATAP